MKRLLLFLLLAATAQADITFVNLGALGSSGNAITVGQPASPQVNDVWIMVVQSSNQTIITPTNTTAGVWTEITPQTGTGTAAVAGAVRLGVYWHRWATTTGNITLADTGDHQLVRIAAYRGVKTQGNPWNAVTTMVSQTSGAGNNIWVPAITTTVDQCWVLEAIAHSIDTADAGQASFLSSSPGSGGAERIDNTLATGTGGGIILTDCVFATASSSNGTNGMSSNIGVGSNLIKVGVALEPATTPLPAAGRSTFLIF